MGNLRAPVVSRGITRKRNVMAIRDLKTGNIGKRYSGTRSFRFTMIGQNVAFIIATIPTMAVITRAKSVPLDLPTIFRTPPYPARREKRLFPLLSSMRIFPIRVSFEKI
jgi:hypothetical protein